MPADLDRRTVKPAHPDATIPDPDHRAKLPADGLEVTWSPYWARLLRRGDVVVVEPETAPAAAPTTAGTAAQAAAATAAAEPTAPAVDAAPAKA